MPRLTTDHGVTEAECRRRALGLLRQRDATAAEVSEYVWPGVTRAMCQADSVARRMTYRAQMLLGRMKRDGLVAPDYAGKPTFWRITAEGRRAER